jgi:hypothetical protein
MAESKDEVFAANPGGMKLAMKKIAQLHVDDHGRKLQRELHVVVLHDHANVFDMHRPRPKGPRPAKMDLHRVGALE